MLCNDGPENGYHVGVGVSIIKSNKILSIHHHQAAEIYFVLGGSSTTEIDGSSVQTKEGECYMIPPNAEHVTIGSPESDLYFIFLYPWHNFNQSVYKILDDTRGPIEPMPQGTKHKDLIDCDEKWFESNYHPELGVRRFKSI
jgi:oxalate decarboxylase/phosphoglucose isomerase-like protein (cupin superfamily)